MKNLHELLHGRLLLRFGRRQFLNASVIISKQIIGVDDEKRG